LPLDLRISWRKAASLGGLFLCLSGLPTANPQRLQDEAAPSAFPSGRTTFSDSVLALADRKIKTPGERLVFQSEVPPLAVVGREATATHRVA
jgi:hypothetical protein